MIKALDTTNISFVHDTFIEDVKKISKTFNEPTYLIRVCVVHIIRPKASFLYSMCLLAIYIYIPIVE